MKTVMQNLVVGLLVASAALGSSQPQSASPEVHVRALGAQHSVESTFASAPCKLARESQNHRILEQPAIDPRTLVPDLDTLVEKSDEIVLAGISFRTSSLLSPSGQSAVRYFDVKVIRSWKGNHDIGDTLTFGVPSGGLACTPPSSSTPAQFLYRPGGHNWRGDFYGPYVLFLRHGEGAETQRVQGLLPAAGAGLQGMFPIQIGVRSQADDQCAGIKEGSLHWCDTYMETSQDPIIVPYRLDPLTKKYDSMPVSDFLREVRSVAAAQGLVEESTVR